MRRRLLAVLIPVISIACAPKYKAAMELDRAIFRRQDSSFVNQAIDKVVQSETGFFSLIATGLKPKEILVNRGDSTWIYQGLGFYVTRDRGKPADLCNPPSFASLVAWRELPNRTGVSAVSIEAAGDSAGISDTLSLTSKECGGPLSMHHPIAGTYQVIGRQARNGNRHNGTGRVGFHIGYLGARRCPKVAEQFLFSQHITAECRLTWMQVVVETRMQGSGQVSGDSLWISYASVPTLHVWVDCKPPNRSQLYCQEQPPPDTSTHYPWPGPPHMIEVPGIVKDANTGAPVAYARIKFSGKLAAYSDSAGRFVAVLPAGSTTPSAECAVFTGGEVSSHAPVVVRPGMPELGLTVYSRYCLPVPTPVQDSLFEGIYTPGVERSEFRLCGKRQLNIWAEFTAAAEADRMRLLARLRGKENPPMGTLYRVRGSLSGPGVYGYRGRSDYILRIDQVQDIRVRTSKECWR